LFVASAHSKTRVSPQSPADPQLLHHLALRDALVFAPEALSIPILRHLENKAMAMQRQQ
jgi:hypothetical protein